ncbi:hypothetical protein FOZ62_001954, partial [Perkinsus olseni]
PYIQEPGAGDCATPDLMNSGPPVTLQRTRPPQCQETVLPGRGSSKDTTDTRPEDLHYHSHGTTPGQHKLQPNYTNLVDKSEVSESLSKALSRTSKRQIVEPYAGRTDPRNVETFLQGLVMDVEYAMGDGYTKTAIILNSLDPVTRNTVMAKYQIEYGNIDNGDFKNLPSILFQLLRDAYSTPGERWDGRLQWESLQLGDYGSFDEYIQQFELLRATTGVLRGYAVSADEAYSRLWAGLSKELREWATDYVAMPTHSPTEEDLRGYINRLRSHCRHGQRAQATQPLAATTITSDNSAQRVASQLAPELASSRNLPPQPSRPRTVGCFRCHQTGHVAARCDAHQPVNGQARCKQCGDSRHLSAACQKLKAQLQCARCHRQGHLASICFAPAPGQVIAQPAKALSQTTTTTAVHDVQTTHTAVPEDPTFSDSKTAAATTATLCAISSQDAAMQVEQPTGIVLQPLVSSASTVPSTQGSTDEQSVVEKLKKAQLSQAPEPATSPQQGPLYSDLMLMPIPSVSGITGKQYKAMVDTGSGYSFVNDKTLCKLLEHKLVHCYRRARTLNVVTAGGHTFRCSIQVQLLIMSKAGTVPIWVYAATGLHNSFLLGVDVLLQLQSVIIMDAQGVKIHTHCRESFSPVSELLNKKIVTKKIPVQAQDITVKKTDSRSFPTTRDDLPELVNGTK